LSLFVKEETYISNMYNWVEVTYLQDHLLFIHPADQHTVDAEYVTKSLVYI